MEKQDLTRLNFRLDTRTRPLLPDTVGVTLSSCGQYRYRLWRIWNNDKPHVLFIGLFPSAGDDTTDDPAVIACQRLAVAAGYGGFHLVSLFAWRSFDRHGAGGGSDPVGKDNDAIIADAAVRAGLVVCAWGGDPRLAGRDNEVIALLRNDDIDLFALAVEQDGTIADLYRPQSGALQPVPLSVRKPA